MEGLLHGVEVVDLADALDRRHLVAVGLDGEDGARLHRLAVEEDGAGAARGRVAADHRARQPELLAQVVDEELSRLDLRRVALAVDRDRDLCQLDLLPMRRMRRQRLPKKSESPEIGFAWAATACSASSAESPSWASRHCGEARDHLRGDVLDHPAPVLGDRAGEREVGDEVDLRPSVRRSERRIRWSRSRARGSGSRARSRRARRGGSPRPPPCARRRWRT